MLSAVTRIALEAEFRDGKQMWSFNGIYLQNLKKNCDTPLIKRKVRRPSMLSPCIRRMVKILVMSGDVDNAAQAQKVMVW